MDGGEQYFAFEVISGEIDIAFHSNKTFNDNYKLEYRLGETGNWNRVQSSVPIKICCGESLYFKGNLYSVIEDEIVGGIGIGVFSEEMYNTDIYIEKTTRYKIKGNIMSLLYEDDFANKYSLYGNDYDYVFWYLFSELEFLIDASELILPATILSNGCYSDMFYNCTNLITAPKLPATILSEACYSNMFFRCNLLSSFIKLPATTLTEYCYSYMFHDCNNLSYIEMLATDISASDCLDGWVSGVSSTGTFVKHPDMNSLPAGESGIPYGWTVENNYYNKILTRTDINEIRKNSYINFTDIPDYVKLNRCFTKNECKQLEGINCINTLGNKCCTLRDIDIDLGFSFNIYYTITNDIPKLDNPSKLLDIKGLIKIQINLGYGDNQNWVDLGYDEIPSFILYRGSDSYYNGVITCNLWNILYNGLDESDIIFSNITALKQRFIDTGVYIRVIYINTAEEHPLENKGFKMKYEYTSYGSKYICTSEGQSYNYSYITNDSKPSLLCTHNNLSNYDISIVMESCTLNNNIIINSPTGNEFKQFQFGRNENNRFAFIVSY